MAVPFFWRWAAPYDFGHVGGDRSAPILRSSEARSPVSARHSSRFLFHLKVIMFSNLKYVPSLRRLAQVVIMAGAAALAGCGGGGGPPPAAPTALAVGYGAKVFNFTWTASAEATSYQLLEDIDGAAGPEDFAVVGTASTPSFALVPRGMLHTRLNARYVVQACNAAGSCSANSAPVQVDANKAIGYFKASSPGAGLDQFGLAVALSADGNTMAVGDFGEDSNATGVDGDSANQDAVRAGAVFVFARREGVWKQQAYIKASNAGTVDYFGISLALSADGNTLSVGAPQEASIDGNPSNDLALGAGAVYVFTRTATAWSQQAYLKASNIAAGNAFGTAVALAADGNTLAASAPSENGQTGAVYMFTRSGTAWVQQTIVSPLNAATGNRFGTVLALSGEGNTLAVGVPYEDSSATIIDGNGLDTSAVNAGAVYVFARTGAAWPQQAYVKAPNAAAGDSFGLAVALSVDGNTLAVGAPGESSGATGLNGNEGDNNAPGAGAVYVFGRTGATWTKQAYVKASNTGAGDEFGSAVGLSNDGNILAVGASSEGGASVGLGGDQASNAAGGAGAAYVFMRAGATWTQQAYIKASNTQPVDRFGSSLVLSGDGTTLAVGATGEDSKATGVNGDQSDNSIIQAGAVYVY
jgi:hypothetical protein